MTQRLVALLLTVAAAAVYIWKGGQAGGLAPGLVAALLALAAVLLASGRMRTVLAVGAVLGWAAALVLDLGSAPLLLAAAACGLAGAALTVVRGSTWLGWSDRYSRDVGAGAPPDDPRAMWDSLDRGVDPTQNDDAPRTP